MVLIRQKNNHTISNIQKGIPRKRDALFRANDAQLRARNKSCCGGKIFPLFFVTFLCYNVCYKIKSTLRGET